MAKKISFRKHAFFAAVTLLGVSTATAAGDMGMKSGTINIMSPKDGADVYLSSENKMEYEVTLGAGDDHFHVWVDGEKGPAQRALKGSYVLPKMMPGNHAVIVKIVDKAHVPTGPEKTIFVKAE